MDRFFVKKEWIDFENNSMTIRGEDVKHISKVLRYKVGDRLEVCDGADNEFICEIVEINKDSILLGIIEKKDMCRESNIEIRLYQGLPKNTKMEIILQKLTESGVSEIILVDTDRTVVSVDEKKSDKKLGRWERIIYESAKQCKRGVIPKLKGIMSFKDALEDMKNNDINISPYENENALGIKEVLISDNILSIIERKLNLQVKPKIGIFIGPEGGFTEEENFLIRENGAKSVKMGPRIFRTETAAIVATAIVQYEFGDLGGV
ncbi:RsmE family RNA methyltransferase [Peptostreptococcus sp. D1]|uniref:RsmE family RNA methyltransferase n=1 Tax=Peptostreptococcus sp. D1 TaxID=72304 RepID=UPI0008F16914|nr:RsmE family RNA methyltransferase [Peptostreptococcus sp. D1]SFE15671.1 16S rRNA (uracil1498-N3)-methyltransferase [Peptostreptococcus sp. D1]